MAPKKAPVKSKKTKAGFKVPNVVGWLGHRLVLFAAFVGRQSAKALKAGKTQVAMAAGIVVLLFFYAFSSFTAYAKSLDTFEVHSSQLKIHQRPGWMSAKIEREILNPPNIPKVFSIFDDKAIARVKAAYESYPWISEVREIRKCYPNELQLSFDIRKPICLVELKGKFFYVDRRGVRLSQHDYNRRELNDLPVLYGLDRKEPQIGEAWGGDEIMAGIETLEILQASRVEEELRLSGVELSNVGGKKLKGQSEVVLICNADAQGKGVRVEWGRSSQYSLFGENTPEEKLAHLRGVLSIRPDLQGLSVVKLQFSEPYFQ